MIEYPVSNIPKSFILSLNNYRTYEDNEYYFAFKGHSCSNRPILLSNNNNFYNINAEGEVKYKLSLEPYINDIITDPQELRPNIYGGFLKHSEDPINNKYAVIEYNSINQKCSIIEEYKLLNHSNQPLNYHLSKYITSGHIILMSCGFDNDSTEFTIIQEQKDGQIIWEWDSREINNPEQYLWGQIPPWKEDLHLNGLDVWDNTIIVSSRNIGIICINKDTNQFKWIIGDKINSFNFKDIPHKQHNIKFINNHKFITFDNNYIPVPKYEITRSLLELDSWPEILIKNRPYCRIIEYDLKNYTSRAFNTNILCTPRCGNAEWIKDNIFDINYGQAYKLIGNKIYKFGLYQEVDFDTNEILFSLVMPTDRYIINRGL